MISQDPYVRTADQTFPTQPIQRAYIIETRHQQYTGPNKEQPTMAFISLISGAMAGKYAARTRTSIHRRN